MHIFDDEVIKLTTALKSRKVVYREEILFEPEDSTGDEGDPLFQEAINVIREAKEKHRYRCYKKLKVGSTEL